MNEEYLECQAEMLDAVNWRARSELLMLWLVGSAFAGVMLGGTLLLVLFWPAR